MTARSSGARLVALIVAFGLAASCFLPSEPSEHLTFEFRFTSPLKVPLDSTVTPVVVVKVGDRVLQDPLLTFVSLNSAIVLPDGTGRRLVGRARGEAQVLVKYTGNTGTVDTTFDVRAVVSFVRVSPSGFTIRKLGDSLQLTARADAPDSVSPGLNLPPDAFTWSSDNPAVATVSARGVVRAVDEGSVRISAQLDDESGVAQVEVLQAAFAVQIRPEVDTLRWLRSTRRFLLAAALDSAGGILDGARARWTSLDPAIATVDATSGVATAIHAGVARIVGRVGLAADTAMLVVKQVPLAMFVRPGLDTLTAIDDTGRVTALGSDSGGSAIPDLVVDWNSENPAIASIDPSGLVTAHANGIVLVTARSGTETAFGTVVVRQTVSRINIQPAAVSLTSAGATAQLSATAADKNGHAVPNPGALAWRSHFGLVATVDSSGLVTARGNGRSAVSATIGGQSGTAPVTVTGAPQELIAFESGNGIEAMRADGSLRTVLIPNLYNCYGYYYYYDCTYVEPAWSPDGTKLAYVYNSYDSGYCYYGCRDIYTAWPDGSDAKSVTGGIGSYNSSPSWSPDGTRIAFSSDRHGGAATIYLMNADGSNVTRLLTGQPGFGPKWSPDGAKIAFAFSDILVVNADGSGLVRLTNDDANDFDPAWSPDGSQIAFASNQDGHNDVWLMNANGTGRTNLTKNLAFPGAPSYTDNYAPVWSPDGLRIVFTSSLCTTNGCDVARFFIVNRDGTGLQALNVDGQNAAWHAAGSLSPSSTLRPSRTARIQR